MPSRTAIETASSLESRAEPGQDALHVVADRVHAEVEPPGHVRRADPVRHQLQDLDLAAGEAVPLTARAGPSRARSLGTRLGASACSPRRTVRMAALPGPRSAGPSTGSPPLPPRGPGSPNRKSDIALMTRTRASGASCCTVAMPVGASPSGRRKSMTTTSGCVARVSLAPSAIVPANPSTRMSPTRSSANSQALGDHGVILDDQNAGHVVSPEEIVCGGPPSEVRRRPVTACRHRRLLGQAPSRRRPSSLEKRPTARTGVLALTR